MINKLDGTFVVPGEKLGVVEEFDPGRGTVEVGGIVYSSQTGVASIDPKRHIVSVKTATGLVVVPEEGSTVVGIVEKVQEKMAIINMIVVDGKKMALPFTGMLHVSNSSPRFERSMWDVVKPNDIIRAKVIDTSQRIATYHCRTRPRGHQGLLLKMRKRTSSLRPHTPLQRLQKR